MSRPSSFLPPRPSHAARTDRAASPSQFGAVSLDQAASDALSAAQALLRSLAQTRSDIDFTDSDGDAHYPAGTAHDFVSVELLAPVLVPTFAAFLVQDDPCPYELRRDSLRLICKNFSISDLAAYVAEVRANDNIGSKIDEHLDLYDSSPDIDDTDQRSSLTQAMKELAPLLARKIMRASLATASKTWDVLLEAQADPDFTHQVADSGEEERTPRSAGRRRPR